MCTYLICLVSLLAALVLVAPVSGEDFEKTSAPAQTLCPFLRIAADQTELEAEARERMQEAQKFSSPGSDALPPIPLENSSPAESPAFREGRKLFESFLVNWRFFEDLAPEQRELFLTLLVRCGVPADRQPHAASIFVQLNASQRATFVAVTQAMMHTWLVDSATGEVPGNALGLIRELITIQGENGALSSDQQFQLIVRLTPDARQKLERAARFEKGENHIFHKDYPVSFRQSRKIWLRGQEAGLHFCLTRDGRFAQIHIDYRFGLLHLGPANSDVRAEGNHQRHADRWPEFTVTVRPVRTRRVVLLPKNLDLGLNSLARE